MSRNAPALSEEQADLAALLGSVMSDVDTELADERPDEVARLRHRLAELGVWTLGVPAEHGGGGADDTLAATVFASLGRRWAALGWAAVQAHAGAAILSGHPEHAELLASVHTGEVGVAVTAGDRVDAAAQRPHVLVLEDPVRLYVPGSLGYRRVGRTGLGGALTAIVEFTGDGVALPGVDADAARVRLWLGAAAVAAGIADAAADAAVAYSRSRHQFGAALSALPTVRESLFAASGAAAGVLRQVLNPAVATPWQAAAVADFACESAIDAAARAVQAHGGYGYLTEYPAARLLRDAVSLRAACDVASAARSGGTAVVG